VRFIRTREDLEAAIADPSSTNVLLSGEGTHTFEGSLPEFRTLYLDGLRMVGLVHFFDSAVGGSAQGEHKGGLTEFGRTWIREAEQIGVTVDLAHASDQLIEDTLAIATKPVVFSHTGVKGVCDNSRNISDDTIRKIAANGGLIGLAYFEPAICERTVKQIVDSILHVVNLVGPEYAALGSDFDGAVTTVFDTTGVPRITEELLAAGLSEDDVRAVLGGNAVRVLLANLPTQAKFEAVAAQVAAAR
jgi:membrane dipeptidase